MDSETGAKGCFCGAFEIEAQREKAAKLAAFRSASKFVLLESYLTAPFSNPFSPRL